MSRSIGFLATALLTALLSAGCAATGDVSSAQRFSAPVTRTGSNIPVAREDPSGSRSPSAAEQQRIDETVLPRPTRSGGGGG